MDRERRLDALREEAARSGRVDGRGGPVVGGPLPRTDGTPGYHGRPVLKPPVWTWEVPLYFFVGGLSGMCAVVAAGAAWTGGGGALVGTALAVAVVGSAVSAALLVSDLGRPGRFLHMLRVFKWRSPMSVGAWLLAAFGGAGAASLGAAWLVGAPSPATGVLAAAAAVLGALLATYTGVLLAATAVPAWARHRVELPVHFGVSSLGSAAALLLLLAPAAGYDAAPLRVLLLAAAGADVVLLALLELRRHGAADRALRQGRAGTLLRSASLLGGPVVLALLLLGLAVPAAVGFLGAAILLRYGWMAVGRASAGDPRAVLEPGG